MLMSVGSAVTAPPRAVSPARTALPPRHSSPLNPLSRPRGLASSTTTTTTAAAAAAAITTRIHLSNLERLLDQSQPQPPTQVPTQEDTSASTKGDGDDSSRRSRTDGGNGIFHALNLHSLFPSSRSAAGEMSPRSLTKLQRLLSDTSRPSPRNSIAPRWRQYHGAGDWAGLLDPLDENLRRELVRYGDLVQAAYHAFHSNPSVRPDLHRPVVLPDRNYRVTRSLYATASVELPRWVAGVAPWMTQRSSWVGYVAVCDNDREIHRMGRRDIVIALRGTATCLEWAENFRAGLVPIDNNSNNNSSTAKAKVECGFWSLYKTAGSQVQSLSASIVEEVRRLMELYKNEELSITVTGHSLGAALAVLVADELSTSLPKASPPVAVFSFGGPRVGNKAFADRVEANGVKVLRVVNSNDVVTRVPLKMPEAPQRGVGWKARVLEGIDGYADVGTELRVDSKVSPYLRPDADAACCHDLEAYLHLVDGFLGSHCPFRSNAKRSLARLLSQQGTNVKKLYMTKARDLAVDTSAAVGGGRSNVALPSPSH